jgi:hypothetical protein
VLGIVASRHVASDGAHVEADELQPAPLQPPDDLAGQAALHRVRLENH